MPRLKTPEHSRMKAIRSRCCGSILACTLKMKPETSFSSGGIMPLSLGCGRGGGGVLRDGVDHFLYAKILQRRAEEYRRQIAR